MSKERVYTEQELLVAFSEPFGQGGFDRDEYKSKVMNKLGLDRFQKPFIEDNNWNEIFEIINNPSASIGTKEAMIREKFNSPTKKS